MAENVNLADLLQRQIKGMQNHELKKFEHELKQRLPDLIRDAGKAAKAEKNPEAQHGR